MKGTGGLVSIEYRILYEVRAFSEIVKLQSSRRVVSSSSVNTAIVVVVVVVVVVDNVIVAAVRRVHGVSDAARLPRSPL